ncbi:hypothetical protein Esti_004976 [Eimeria stiedai]
MLCLRGRLAEDEDLWSGSGDSFTGLGGDRPGCNQLRDSGASVQDVTSAEQQQVDARKPWLKASQQLSE